MAIGTSDGQEFPSKLEEVLSGMDKSASVEPSGQNPIDAGRVIRNKAYDQFRDENDVDINSPGTDIRRKTRVAEDDSLPENAKPAQYLFSSEAEANKEMKLTSQESALYNKHLRNLIGPGGVDNEDGSRSTVLTQVSEFDGRYYLIPTVHEGKILDPGEKMSDSANKLAQKDGLEKYPSYATEEEARSRYDQLHKYMEKDTKTYQEVQDTYKSVLNFLENNFKTPGQEMQNWSTKEKLGYMLSTAMGLVGAGRHHTIDALAPPPLPRVDVKLLGKDMGISNINVGQMATAANSDIPGLGKAHSAMTMVERKAMDDYLSLDVGFKPKDAYERALDNQKAGRMNPSGDSVEDFIKGSKKATLRLINPEVENAIADSRSRREQFMADSEARRQTFLTKPTKGRAGKEENDNPEPGTPLHGRNALEPSWSQHSDKVHNLTNAEGKDIGSAVYREHNDSWVGSRFNPKNNQIIDRKTFRTQQEAMSYAEGNNNLNPSQEPQAGHRPSQEQIDTQRAQREAQRKGVVNVGPGRGVLNDNKEEVMALISKGASPSEVATKYDITPMAVRNWIKRNGRINTIEDILKPKD